MKLTIDFAAAPHDRAAIFSKAKARVAICLASVANRICPDMYPYMVMLQAGALASEMKLEELLIGIPDGDLHAEFALGTNLTDYVNNHPTNQKGTTH